MCTVQGRRATQTLGVKNHEHDQCHLGRTGERNERRLRYFDDEADQLFIHKPDGSTVPITKDEFQSFIDRTHVSESMADTRAQLSAQEWTELIILTHRKLYEEGELKTGARAPVFAELLPKNAVLDIKMIGEQEGTH